jgi:nucleotide-binding universal stress UspA family protein
MKKLLVAVDGSTASSRALAKAAELAKATGGSLLLVHCHDAPDYYGRIAAIVPREKMDALQREHSDDLLQRAEAQLRGTDVPFTREILGGPLGETIAAHAEKSGCDAIVMGRHGQTTLGDVLVGSVAMKVLHASKLPVLLVR